MNKDDFSRPVKMYCCADGTITYSRNGPFNGVALPVFSVNTEEEAKYMQLMYCKLQYDKHPKMKKGEPWYRLSVFSGNVKDLPMITAKFRSAYKVIMLNKPERIAAKLVCYSMEDINWDFDKLTPKEKDVVHNQEHLDVLKEWAIKKVKREEG